MAQENNNNGGLMGIIILLLIVIAGGAFYIGKNMSNGNNTTNPPSIPSSTDTAQPATNNNTESTAKTASVEVTVISDTKCGSACDTAQLLTQLKQVPSLAGVTIKELDYSESEAQKILTSADVKLLPAAIFSHSFIKELSDFLKPAADGKYYLEMGSSYDPTIKRSKNGFRVLEKSVIDNLKEGTFIKGNKDASITWIEYSDLECPFCAKLHTQGTPKEVREKYGDKLNVIFQHFPLDFHKNAMPGAELLECLGKEKGIKAFYQVIDASFKNGNSALSFLLDEAVKAGGNKEALEKCVTSNTYKEKVTKQMQNGTSLFGVTGTPGNVLINNKTGEYEVISGAYPSASFIEIIDRMLK